MVVRSFESSISVYNFRTEQPCSIPSSVAQTLGSSVQLIWPLGATTKMAFNGIFRAFYGWFGGLTASKSQAYRSSADEQCRSNRKTILNHFELFFVEGGARPW